MDAQLQAEVLQAVEGAVLDALGLDLLGGAGGAVDDGRDSDDLRPGLAAASTAASGEPPVVDVSSTTSTRRP